MIRKIQRTEIPAKRKASPVTSKAIEQFNQLKRHLESSPLAPYEATMITLDVQDKKVKPTTLKNGILKLKKMTEGYIKQKAMPYRTITRQENGELALYIVGSELG